MRVMLDTNILISAFVFKSKKMNDLIYRLSVNHEIIICSYTIEEVRNLIKEKFKIKKEALKRFLQEFPFELIQSPKEVKKKLCYIRDENDYIILHTAIINNIDIFITGDKDFQDVNILKPKIMTASEFLENYY